MKRRHHRKGHGKKHSTRKWERCITKTAKYCRKHHRPNQSIMTCQKRICASIKHRKA